MSFCSLSPLLSPLFLIVKLANKRPPEALVSILSVILALMVFFYWSERFQSSAIDLPEHGSEPSLVEASE